MSVILKNLLKRYVVANVGDKFELDLKVCNLSADKKKAIQMRCHDFIVEAVKQIDKRIDKTTMKQLHKIS